MPMQNTNLGGAATGTATSAQVLQGYTFSNASGNDIAGTVVDNGAPTLQPGDSIAAGYYSGGSVAAASVAVPATGSQSFTTPGSTAFTVPAEVTRLLAQIWSGGGGGMSGYAGGQGAYVSALLSVTPGQTLDMIVGSGGTSGANPTVGGFSAIYNGYSPLIQVPGGGAATSSAVGSGAVAPTSGIFTVVNGGDGNTTSISAPGVPSSGAYAGGGLVAGTMFAAWNVTSTTFQAAKGNDYVIAYGGATSGSGTLAATATIGSTTLTQILSTNNGQNGFVVWSWTAQENATVTVEISSTSGPFYGGYTGILVAGCESPGTPTSSNITTNSYSGTTTDPSIFFLATGGAPSALPTWGGTVQDQSTWGGQNEFISTASAEASASVSVSWSGGSATAILIAVPCGSVNNTSISADATPGAVILDW